MPPRKAGVRARKLAHRKSGPGKSAPAKSAHRKSQRKSAQRWSARVTRTSDALDLKRGVFNLKDPKRIAASMKRSAEQSARKKSGSYRSALSMLTFYINRAGKNLSAGRRKTLESAKDELRRQFGRA
jgi:hypothetical protein